MERVDGQDRVRVAGGTDGARRLPDGRVMMLGEFPTGDDFDQFAAMVPAFDEAERGQIERVIGALLDRGCLEFTCIGPEAELLHDDIDALIEARGAFEVLTTWHTSVADAVEYFVLVAGGRAVNLVALVDRHPALVTALEAVSSGA